MARMVTRLHFLGGTRMATGSSFLVHHGYTRILVDCGLMQGPPAILAGNREPFQFDPSELKVIVVTQAQLGHSGLVPRLVEEGFRGRILTTAVTKDLLSVAWKDFADSQQQLQGGIGTPRAGLEEPALYMQLAVERALSRCDGVSYNTMLAVSPSIQLRFQDAGHILGSAILELWVDDLKIVFSGTLGYSGKPISRDPVMIEAADVVVMESTYGDRNHKPISESVDELGKVIASTLADGGWVLMPVSTAGRCQELLYLINQLSLNGILNSPSVYVDNAMGQRATEIYGRHLAVNDEAGRLILHPSGHAGAPVVRFAETSAESRQIPREGPGIVLAGSDMCDGGRILDHLTRHVDNAKASVIFTTYQAEGTLGHRLAEGAVYAQIHGKMLPVKAQIHTIDALSAQADQTGLMNWIGGFRKPLPSIYLVHGETSQTTVLAQTLRSRYGIRAVIPESREMALLSPR